MIKDCALVSIATGRRAGSLPEFRDGIRAVPQESIYFHFWGRLLRPRFDDPEYHSDFASWVQHNLHDELLAERLAVIDPADFADLERLREEVVEVIDAHLQSALPVYTRPDRQFHFRRCQTVVFDARHSIGAPEQLPEALRGMSLGSIYYHVIDARRREPVRKDDVRAWLEDLGGAYQALADQLGTIDPYFSNLAEIRDQMAGVAAGFFGEGSSAR
ncbi:MAG: hypothetical protein J0M16_05095 [Gammaproteobacteria bacterium]|nr:hypothetical protein [Gammaproteobacteria bacterium]